MIVMENKVSNKIDDLFNYDYAKTFFNIYNEKKTGPYDNYGFNHNYNNKVDMQSVINSLTYYDEMAKKYSINFVGYKHSTLLHYTDNVEDIKLLLDKNIQLKFTYDEKSTIKHPLLFHINNNEILDLLLEYKNKYELYDLNGYAITYDFKDLIYASKDVTALEILKKHGILQDITLEEYVKNVKKHYFNSVKYLVENALVSFDINKIIKIYNNINHSEDIVDVHIHDTTYSNKNYSKLTLENCASKKYDFSFENEPEYLKKYNEYINSKDHILNCRGMDDSQIYDEENFRYAGFINQNFEKIISYLIFIDKLKKDYQQYFGNNQ